MSNFQKKLNKYTKTYSKQIKKFEFKEEEQLVFLTMAYSISNALIYFVGGLKETKSEYSGFNVKVWEKELKEITEKQVHDIFKSITQEYFDTYLESYTATKKEDKDMLSMIKGWRLSFSNFTKGLQGIHLIDSVFPNLYLENATRNEVPVMAFVAIIESLFERLDITIENALKEFYKVSKEDNVINGK